MIAVQAQVAAASLALLAGVVIALLLAMPGIGWGTWWLIHWDSKKSNP